MAVLGRINPPTPPTPPASRISIPSLVSDPIWSLKQWPIVVEMGHSAEWVIPAMCAADWLQVLMAEDLDPEDVFPGLLSEPDRVEVEDQLHHGVLLLAEVHHTALEVISQVSGRPWWVALRLIQGARAAWDALGGDVVRKADASILSLAGWLDVLFLVLVRAVEDDKRDMFLLKLQAVPLGWEEDNPEELEMSTDAFLAMAGE